MSYYFEMLIPASMSVFWCLPHEPPSPRARPQECLPKTKTVKPPLLAGDSTLLNGLVKLNHCDKS